MASRPGPRGIVTFGYKHRTPALAVGDIRIDVRQSSLRNPYNVQGLRDLTGAHPAVVAYLEQSPGFEAWYTGLKEQVAQCSGTVFLGCTGGRHRSVYVGNRLARDFACHVTHLHYNG